MVWRVVCSVCLWACMVGRESCAPRAAHGRCDMHAPAAMHNSEDPLMMSHSPAVLLAVLEAATDSQATGVCGIPAAAARLPAAGWAIALDFLAAKGLVVEYDAAGVCARVAAAAARACACGGGGGGGDNYPWPRMMWGVVS